jgi:FkbM family methyltransferase
MISSTVRIGASLVRSRFSAFAKPIIPVGDERIFVHADLRTPSGLRLYRYGFNDPLADLLRARLRPGDTFVDGGANIGLFTLVGAAIVGPTGRVLACEPAPETMRRLRSNVTLNRFDWVTLKPVALGAERGRAAFWSFGAGAGLSALAPAETAGAVAHDVEIATLDDLGAELTSVRLVKLDIEGAEVSALRGARAFIERFRPEFVVEVEPAHLERNGSSVAELRTLFDDAGYVPHEFWAGPGGIEIRRVEALDERSAPGVDVLFRPREVEA